MRKMTFWIVLVLAFLAGFFLLGLGISVAFLVGAIVAGPLGKALSGFKWMSLDERFWVVNLAVTLLLYLFAGGSIAVGWLAGAVFAWIWE